MVPLAEQVVCWEQNKEQDVYYITTVDLFVYLSG